MNLILNIVLLILVSMMLGAGLMFIALKDIIELEKLGWLKDCLFESDTESE